VVAQLRLELDRERARAAQERAQLERDRTEQCAALSASADLLRHEAEELRQMVRGAKGHTVL